MKGYKRLTFDEREEISRLLALKKSLSEIARTLNRDKSAISREISAGGCNQYTYRAVKAEKRAKRKAAARKTGKRKTTLNWKLCRYVFSNMFFPS